MPRVEARQRHPKEGEQRTQRKETSREQMQGWKLSRRGGWTTTKKLMMMKAAELLRMTRVARLVSMLLVLVMQGARGRVLMHP